MAPGIIAIIGGLVDSRVMPLWRLYVSGGTPTILNLSTPFGADFTSDPNTGDATDFLVRALRADLTARPPTFPPGRTRVRIPLVTRIPTQLAEIDNPTGPNRLAFAGLNIPGNLAGGIGKTQLACTTGANPSPINDLREANGTAFVTDNGDGTLTVEPSIDFRVLDTMDFCPGNCGDPVAWGATLPFSVWEASGISGDVPFKVEFPAPAAHTAPFRITPVPPPPPPTPPPKKVTVREKVLFEYDSAAVTEPGKEFLKKKLLPQLQASKSTIDVVGHTDSRGSDEYNQDLSQRRAQAVVDELVSQDPTLAGRLHPSGRGEEKPVVRNATTEEEHAQNRRVELIFGGP